MLDEFIVFDMGGLVLFRKNFAVLKGNPVDALIRTVLLENRETTATAFNQGQYSLKYLRENKSGVVFVAVYQSMLAPAYVDDLLESVSKSFCRVYKDQLAQASGLLEGFESKFDKLLWEAEEASMRSRRVTSPKTKANPEEDDDEKDDQGEQPEDEEGDQVDLMMESLRMKKARQAKGPRAFQGKKKDKGKSKSGKEKEMRVWGEHAKLTKEEEEALNMSGVTEEDAEKAQLEKAKKYLPEEENEKADLDKSEDEEEDEDSAGWFASSKLGNLFASLTGQKPLSREDITPAIEKMEKQLLAKNVSTDAAQEIAEAVAQDLEGKKLGSFTRGIGQAVKESCHAALSRLLTPKRSTDILREAKAAKAAGRPYTIVFVGVNGVGKSTSLSKVCYYLKQNGLKVLICACDTFRSGAVEQLKVHTRNLQVDLFEQGYNKDAASVAANGIKHAQANGFDVVLVDTAGRMQNNEPLMRALSRLISKNSPDLVLFVGEALAGNDGRDQLVEFDKALVNYSDSGEPRRIDGMILTKFDTIDDKVGAAVSMVHSSGQPIIFVGTGQKYTNLNKLNVSKVVKALLN